MKAGETAVVFPRAGHRLALNRQCRRTGTISFRAFDIDGDGFPLLLPLARLMLIIGARAIRRKLETQFYLIRNVDNPSLDTTFFRPVDRSIPAGPANIGREKKGAC